MRGLEGGPHTEGFRLIAEEGTATERNHQVGREPEDTLVETHTEAERRAQREWSRSFQEEGALRPGWGGGGGVAGRACPLQGLPVCSPLSPGRFPQVLPLPGRARRHRSAVSVATGKGLEHAREGKRSPTQRKGKRKLYKQLAS